MEAANLRRSAAVVVLSEHSRREVLTFGYPPAQIRLIPGGTDLERFHPATDRAAARQRLGLPAGQALLLSVRRLAPRMGLDNLVRSMPAVVARRPDVLLLIGGKGPERERLERLVAELGLEDHVRLLGFIADDDLAAYYQAADAFVLPTLALEGFGLVTTESLACGTPVLGTPVGATPEILRRLDARLVLPGTGPEALAEGITAFLGSEWWAGLTPERLHRFVQDNYTWDAHVQAVETNLSGDDRAMTSPKDNAPVPILYVDHTAKMGGGEIALLNLVTALDRTRFEPVVVLASDGPLVGRLRGAGVETHILPLAHSLINTRKDSLGASSLLQVRQAALVALYVLRLACWVRRRGVRLIHTNSLKADVYGGLAGRLAGIPVVWHVRDSINGEYLPPRVAALFRRLARTLPQVVVANSESTLRFLETGRERNSTVVYSGIAKGAEAGDAARSQIVHDGYDLQTFPHQVPAQSQTSVDGPVVTLVGRITPWKGQDVFLRAAAQVRRQFPRTHFWIIGSPMFGEDEYERSLHVLARELGLAEGEQVTFWGQRDDVPALMSRTDILVHASTLGEPFGQVVIEGMAAGKPVIATEGGALPEIVLPGETGLLVPMGNAEAMAEAVCALLSDPARAAAMGAAGRRRVQEKFTITHTVRKVETVYDRMLNPIPDPPPEPAARE